MIPIVFRNLDKGDVGLPLSELQVRSLHDPREVRALLDDIANRIGLKTRSVDKELFVEELQEVEKGLPSKGIRLVPFLDYQDHETIELKFRLVNTGNKDIELIELWTVIPVSIQKRYWSAMPVPPALMVDEQSHGNRRLITFKYSAGVEPARTGYYRPDFVVLPRLLSVGMFPFQVKELRFVLKHDLSEVDAAEIIRFGVYARGASSTGELKLKDIDGFQS